VDVFCILLEHGVDLSVQDKGRWTPLHLASKGGLVDIVHALLNYSTDMTAQDRDGWTPLHRASRGGHLDVTCILLEHGADVKAQDKLGWTALHHISRGGHVDVAHFILIILVTHDESTFFQNDERSTGWTHVTSKSKPKARVVYHTCNICSVIYF